MPATKTKDPKQVSAQEAMDALAEKAHRRTAEREAKENLSYAKARLGHMPQKGAHFLSSLSFALDGEPDWEIETTETNGSQLRYNPDYLNRLTEPQRVGVVCQNVLHCGLHHLTRQGFRSDNNWNLACDLAVNPIVEACGVELPPDSVYPGRGQHSKMPQDTTAEEYYALLPPEPPQGSGGDGQGDVQGDGKGPSGTKNEGQSQDDDNHLESKWDSNMAAAEQQASHKQGDLPGNLLRVLEEARTPQVSWQEVLRQFINARARNDYTWQSPNRRFVGSGLYLPGLHSDEIGELVVAVDTSGSICAAQLAQFAGEINGMLESFDVTVTIIYHDSAVAGVQVWKSADGPLIMEPRGGGGTDHRPVFEWVEQSMPDPPTCMILLTDLYSSFPDNEPPYPTIWCDHSGNKDEDRQPFGMLVPLQFSGDL